MYIILTYDTKVKRVAKARKIVKKYLNPVQRSVFEGFLLEGRLSRLQEELKKVIVCEEDSVRVYKLQNMQRAEVDCLDVVAAPLSRIL